MYVLCQSESKMHGLMSSRQRHAQGKTTLQPSNQPYSDLDQSRTVSYLRGHFNLVIWLKTV